MTKKDLREALKRTELIVLAACIRCPGVASQLSQDDLQELEKFDAKNRRAIVTMYRTGIVAGGLIELPPARREEVYEVISVQKAANDATGIDRVRMLLRKHAQTRSLGTKKTREAA